MDFKIGRGPKQTLFPREHTDGQWTQESMFSTTNHQRNTNQNHSEKSPHTPERLLPKRQKNNKSRQGFGEWGTLMDCW